MPPSAVNTTRSLDPDRLAAKIRLWGADLGFQRTGISDADLTQDEARLEEWLAAGHHGEMSYMVRHGVKRSRPAELLPGTASIITARMDYFPPQAAPAEAVLADSQLAYISRYALGRDYHKLLRKRLQRLAARISREIGPFGYRVFVDSAPVLEKALARKSGLGWMGKHTNLLSKETGSWFFLGEVYTDLRLPADSPVEEHCGSCEACIEVCPTGAISAPYRLDARLCISYLTIELRGSIPIALRPKVGNRIYGCDDCQLFCPWNRFAKPTPEADFLPRHGLDAASLVALFAWDEPTFLARTQGTAIRRIGHECWLRNIAVALGNAATADEVVAALRKRSSHSSAMVREHVQWALCMHDAC